MILRCLFVGILLAAYAPSGIAGTSLVEALDLTEIQIKAELRRNNLLAAMRSEDEFDRFIAIAEIEGGLSQDTQIAQGLLDNIEAIVGEGPRGADPVFDDTLVALAVMEESAWTEETIKQFDRIFNKLRGLRGRFIQGEAREALQVVKSRINDLRGVDTLYGEVQGLIDEKAQFTDIDFFVCVDWAENEDVVRVVRNAAEEIAESEFGRVRLQRSNEALEKSLELNRPSTTIVFDQGHSEEKLAFLAADILQQQDLPEVEFQTNNGRPSFWYLSVFVCP